MSFKLTCMMRKLLLGIVVAFGIYACGGGGQSAEGGATEQTQEVKEETGGNASGGITDTLAWIGPEGVPIKHVELGPLDQELAKKGKELFKLKCTACHKIDQRYVGPALKGVTKRRNPAWIMNQMLVPDYMIEHDPITKKLLEEYLAKMTFQNITEEDARAILEYLRWIDEKGTEP